MTIASSIVIVSVAALLLTLSVMTLWSMLHAWRDPETLRATGFSGEIGSAALSFSLIVPARHEEEVLEDTLERLMRLDHPEYEVIVVVGHDDDGTAEIARMVERRYAGQLRVVVDGHIIKNKPKALNSALPYCRYEVVGVFDAEDEVDPRLLLFIDATFRAQDADVVQGGVQLTNFRSSW